MTIAAGFCCREGVLLCADTEQTAWAMKLHGKKVDHFEFPGGKVGYAYAGNTRFAFSAIQKLERRLKASKTKDVLAVIENLLDQEYRRNVLKHPDHATDASIPYQILLAVWLHSGETRLYVTAQTAIQEITDYECIGVGDYLAHYLIRQSFAGGSVRSALALAAYSLAGIKDYVLGCGGMSVYVFVHKDGRVGVVTSEHDGPCSQLQQYAKTYDFSTRELLMSLANEDSEDKHFEQYLAKVFVPRLIEVRRKWTKARQQREAQFKGSNPHLDELRAREIFRDLSIGLLPLPPPKP